jgi:hypothetical protein
MEIPQWMSVLLAIVLSIPSVRAFPSPCAPTSVTSSFKFANIPYRNSVCHIHTIEHLESISAGEYFQIQRVGQPVRYGPFVTISTDCSIQGVNHTICQLARPDQSNVCTYMCLQGSTLRAQVRLHVQPSSKFGGHVLTMETTCFSGRRVLDRSITPAVRFLASFEDIARNRPLKMRALNQRPNMQWYRRIVLGLHSDGEEGRVGGGMGDWL